MTLTPEQFTSLLQLPLVLAIMLVLIYTLRFSAAQDEAWREHERQRDVKYTHELSELRQEVHRQMVILVLHHASTLDGKQAEMDSILNYIKGGFSSPQAAGVAVQ